MGSLSLNKKQDDFVSVLLSLEIDANCSRSTKYTSKLVQNFLDEPIEKKKTVTLNSKSFAYHQMMTLLVEFLNNPVPWSAGVESIFSLRIKMFFAQRG